MSASSRSLESTILLTSGVFAATSAFALVTLQSDWFSRRFLSPARLQAKRQAQYDYEWKTALEKTHLGRLQLLNPSVQPQLVTSKEVSALALDTLEAASPCLFQIGRDLDRAEYYLWMQLHQQHYQVPLQAFGLALADLFDDKLTTTTLCFVSDASSGLGTTLLTQLVEQAKTGVVVIPEPVWMADLAHLATQAVIQTKTLERVLFALCRLEAWRVRDQVGDVRTVMFTLPGQATTPILAPMLQTVFPEDRHVFVYDGCVASVQRGMTMKHNAGRIPDSLQDALQFSHAPTRHTTPLSKSLCRALRDLNQSLAQLTLKQASLVETWMASVDAFFKLKADETTNGYLPYVCKVGFLLDRPEDCEIQEGDAGYWSLRSLLQFVTGCRSRPLPDGVMDAALSWLRDFSNDCASHVVPKLTEAEKKNVEACVFRHKLILIGDKTLQDTVQPTQHWTLKQASKKGGCACCGPDPFEEEEEEEELRKNQTTTFSTAAMERTGQQSGFVDGKLGFAFDPTRFS